MGFDQQTAGTTGGIDMKLRVLGMSPRDAMAFDLFMQKTMSGWQWEHVLAHQTAKHTEVDIWVIDMATQGWAQGTDAHLTHLSALIAQQCAVLLVSGQDQTWSSLVAAQPMPHCTWLRKPYGAQRMREVLTQIAQVALSPPKSLVSKMSQSPGVAVTTNVMQKEILKPAAIAQGLSSESLAAKLALAPMDRYILLRQISARLADTRPFEVRFTVQNSLIVNPASQWVSTNTPLQVIKRVCDSNALAAAVSIRDMEPAEAEERTQRLAMDIKDLFTFLHDISFSLGWQESPSN